MRKKITYLLLIFISIAMMFVLTGCESNETGNTTSTSNTKNTASNNTNTEEGEIKLSDIDFKEAAEKQMALPNSGDTIAIMHVKDYGDIKFKFFA